MSRLAINLATRGRPDLLKATIERTLQSMTNRDTRLMVSVDEDDAATLEAFKTLPNDDRLRYSIKSREDTLGAKYNRILGTPADVYLAMVDYAPHVTRGFDDMILAAAKVFPDDLGVIYNRLANLSFPEINAVTAGLVARMGFLYPPYFPYWFIDHWLDDIAKMIDRIAVVPQVRTDLSKRPGTQDRRELAFWATFFDATYLMRRRCARDIIRSDAFQEPEWRKKLLLNGHHALIEQRSVMVNSNARAIAGDWAKAVPPEAVDDRYRRVRAAAVALVKSELAAVRAEEATEKVNREARERVPAPALP